MSNFDIETQEQRGFNGATSFRTWKRQCCQIAGVAMGGFNGATSFRTWKPQQGLRITLVSSAASMEPRPFERGNGPWTRARNISIVQGYVRAALPIRIEASMSCLRLQVIPFSCWDKDAENNVMGSPNVICPPRTGGWGIQRFSTIVRKRLPQPCSHSSKVSLCAEIGTMSGVCPTRARGAIERQICRLFPNPTRTGSDSKYSI